MPVEIVDVPLFKSGGVNVINFNVNCASLHLSNFHSLTDDFGICKWHYLARYFLGNRLAILDSRFSFAINMCPMFLLVITLSV